MTSLASTGGAYAMAGVAITTLLAIMALTWFVEMLAFRPLPPTMRATCTVGVAWVIAVAATIWWETRRYAFDGHIALRYLPAALIVWFFYRRTLVKDFTSEG
jgi:hypothetical protein